MIDVADGVDASRGRLIVAAGKRDRLSKASVARSYVAARGSGGGGMGGLISSSSPECFGYSSSVSHQVKGSSVNLALGTFNCDLVAIQMRKRNTTVDNIRQVGLFSPRESAHCTPQDIVPSFLACARRVFGLPKELPIDELVEVGPGK
ncbi:hypothetical protein JR316_0006647 [Psilocybe cubensis]|uniref:Uncharacterized protein n=1 Tax=Psilocybe cubensis TaxID=181762 RepID=A0ACB8GYK1_PSICU|nr:hypothetical protein JR316_0006647 [Psilocybe cubensis]KAH9480050.1 hypothetical protein JR316_0006647 [Psilocybe cubensis]